MAVDALHRVVEEGGEEGVRPVVELGEDGVLCGARERGEVPAGLPVQVSQPGPVQLAEGADLSAPTDALDPGSKHPQCLDRRPRL